MNRRSKTVFAKRSLGQNFLVDRSVVNRILAAFDPKETDVVLEIGPGRGALTAELIERAGRTYALEFDDTLAADLEHTFADRPSFSVIHADALDFDFRSIALGGKKLRLIANLPYNISTTILQRLFDHAEVLSDCLLMFQREVVDRIAAKPGTTARGYLSVMTEAFFRTEKLFDVSPKAFRPVPKVWSSIVKLIPHDPPVDIPPGFHQLVARGFGQKRKTILNNLRQAYASAEPALSACGIDASRRAETLSLDEWLCLARELKNDR